MFGASQGSKVYSVSTSKSGKEFLSNAIFTIASRLLAPKLDCKSLMAFNSSCKPKSGILGISGIRLFALDSNALTLPSTEDSNPDASTSDVKFVNRLS